MKTIVVAVDFSPITPHLLLALEAVANTESKVYLVHVAAPEPDFVGFGVGPQYIRDDRALELREEHKQLGNYKTHLHKKGLDVEALLVSGPTVETILNEVEKLKADILVIGRKQHSSLYELVMGSVCQDVLQKIKIPALLIPERD
jgi:nucleotide-binding universal stress UspA family protein